MDGGIGVDISIIIPCHNLENYIGKCIGSVIKQSYDKDKFEIIVVLDACTDRTGEIVKDILGVSGITNTVLTINSKNAGTARNVGLNKAIGEYIYFMDGDDYFTDDDALLILFESIRRGDNNVVYMTDFESEDTEIYKIEKDAIWRFFFQRGLIGKTRFLPAPINEDWLFVFNIRNKSDYKEGKVDKILYHYTHPRAGSITDCASKMMRNLKMLP